MIIILLRVLALPCVLAFLFFFVRTVITGRELSREDGELPAASAFEAHIKANTSLVWAMIVLIVVIETYGYLNGGIIHSWLSVWHVRNAKTCGVLILLMKFWINGVCYPKLHTYLARILYGVLVPIMTISGIILYAHLWGF